MTKLCPAHQLPDSIPPAPQSTLDEDNTQPLTSQSTLDEDNAELFTSPSTQQGSQTSLLPPPPAEILQPSPPVDHPPSTSGVGR